MDHPWPEGRPHNARNITLGFVGCLLATLVFAAFSRHPTSPPTLADPVNQVDQLYVPPVSTTTDNDGRSAVHVHVYV